MLCFDSPVITHWHRVSVIWKFLCVCVCSVALFWIDAIGLQLAALLTCCLLYLSAGLTFFYAGLKRLRFLWPIMLVILVWHGLTGTALQGAGIALRLTSIVALSNLMTMTSRLSDLLGLVECMFKPLSKLGVNTRPVEIAVALVVRYTPVLIVKGGLLIEAWRARSIRKSNWRVVFPLCLVAIDDAERVAEALKARGGSLRSSENSLPDN